MTALEEAHKDAQSGGYVTGFMYDRLAAIDPLSAMEILWLDPQWWQALGKEREWKGEHFYMTFEKQDVEDESLLDDEEEHGETRHYQPMWLYNWHRFIDHLASGQDAESFFKTLV